ncbi:putative serine/threonine-protein kinase iksA [Paramyrothecium foliicola]|nr:putative serine/threonine-protein kinase iksA [Paramyrothecium foliicola]
MEPATVIGLVTALVETYADGLEDYTTWKAKRSASNRYEGRGLPGTFCALTTSLAVSGPQIKETYDNALSVIGSEFSTGDSSCRSLLWAQLNVLSHCVASLHRAAAATSALVDISSAIRICENVRRASLHGLADQYRRLATGRPIAKTLAIPRPRAWTHERSQPAHDYASSSDGANVQAGVTNDEDDKMTTTMTVCSGTLRFQSEPPSPPPTPKAPDTLSEISGPVTGPTKSVFALFCPEAMSLQVNLKLPMSKRSRCPRHRNAIVVRDTTSQRLEIRGLPECPTCHQPLNRNSTSSPFERPFEMHNPESYVDPEYFRMLQAGHAEVTPQRPPSSPIRRFFQPALAGSGTPRERSSSVSTGINDDVEFVSSTPGVAQAEGSRIRREAFSPNYFSTFFVEEKVLGKGGKGVVLLVRHEIDGCHLGHFACKRVPVGDDHAWLEKVLIEVELLAKLSHPNLVSYRHVWLEDVRLTRFGPSVACAFILQQYCNSGDLHQYVIGNVPRETSKEELKARMRRRSKGQAENPAKPFPSKTPLSFEEIYSLFRDVTSGVAYLHSANYIHRDLKPSNCLLHREGSNLTCLISDFGEVQAENVVRKSTGSTGTISYCAPEVLKMDAAGRYGNFTTKSDIFSLGMILYFMCFGRLPYRSANALQEELEDIDALRAEITDWRGFQDERRERPDLPSKLYTLLKKLLALNASDRPSAAEVLAAMRNEASFEGLARDRGSTPSIDLRGSRVQNLDSPAMPGTPVPGKQSP